MTDAIDVEDQADDQPVPPACEWGMPGWCQHGRHARCWFTRGPEGIGDAYGWDKNGHRWTCPCPCHEHQGFPPCPGDHDDQAPATAAKEIGTVQLNLF